MTHPMPNTSSAVVVVALVLTGLVDICSECRAGRPREGTCHPPKCTDDDNSSYRNVCIVVLIIFFGRDFHYKAVQHFRFSCTNLHRRSKILIWFQRTLSIKTIFASFRDLLQDFE